MPERSDFHEIGPCGRNKVYEHFTVCRVVCVACVHFVLFWFLIVPLDWERFRGFFLKTHYNQFLFHKSQWGENSISGVAKSYFVGQIATLGSELPRSVRIDKSEPSAGFASPAGAGLGKLPRNRLPDLPVRQEQGSFLIA